MNAYWFALSFLWNSMGPILLPTLVPMLVPESQKGSALGTLSALGLIIATIVQPAAGAWSDGRTTRWGKRRPYIVFGIVFASLLLVMMFFAKDYIVLLIAYILLQFSSNIAHGPYQSYIPELVPENKRGKVTGVKQLFEMVGLIITSLVVGDRRSRVRRRPGYARSGIQVVEEPDTRQVVKLTAVFQLLEATTDKCQDVANVLEGVVLENG